jgi:hypothetical protein
MNPIQRKANRVEMNSNDHRGAQGGLRRLRRPRLLTCAAVLGIVAAIPVAAGAATSHPTLPKPSGLQTFNVRLGDSRALTGSEDGAPTFSRTPSFAWKPVRGATSYEFELSTSKRYRADNAVVWSSKTLTTPAASVPISLPWITGPSLYWHVRAWHGSAFSDWSDDHRFNVRWLDGVPRQLSGAPGYIRWTPIEGATGYDVWFGNLGSELEDGHSISVGKIFSTETTVADEREFTTLREPGSSVQWRVRARRQLYGATKNGLPRVSYGPWSPSYVAAAGTTNLSTSVAKPLRAVSSDVTSSESARPHSLMPVFVFSRDSYQFHRVYISTDRDCVNVVHVGSIVGGTTYAPRASGPLALSKEEWDRTHSFLVGGEEGKTLRSDGEQATTNEMSKKDAAANGSTGKSTPSSEAKTDGPAPVDLWDSNWPTGRYYWTVVPVTRHIKEDDKGSKPASTEGKDDQPEWEYQDVKLPQDMCNLPGGVRQFAKKSSNPILSAGAAPFVTGLSPTGRLLSAATSQSAFFGVPLVAWTAASGAVAYDVEWSRVSDPWHKVGSTRTYSTSAMLPLSPGKWYYRVRGINPYLPGNTKMSWSGPMPVLIAKPTFSVQAG